MKYLVLKTENNESISKENVDEKAKTKIIKKMMKKKKRYCKK